MSSEFDEVGDRIVDGAKRRRRLADPRRFMILSRSRSTFSAVNHAQADDARGFVNSLEEHQMTKKALRARCVEGPEFCWVPQAVRRHRTLGDVMAGRDLNVNAKRRLRHPDRNRPCEENLYTSIPIKPWLTAMATACSLFVAPSFRSAQKSNVSISLSLTPIRVAMSWAG
jgi:hypothetical protein